MGNNTVGRETLTRAGRPKTAAVVALALSVGVLTIALASAQAADRPVISGNPIVGETLTASPPSGDPPTGVYKWQSCDPAVNDCSDGPRNDPDWEDILGAQGQHPQFQTYTLTTADLGKFIRVLTHDTSLGAKFTPSLPVGPVTSAAAAGGASQQSQLLPQHGIFVIGELLRGTVRFKPPGQKGYTTLTGKTPIAVNSLIDTRSGSIMLTAATGEFGNRDPDNSMEFFDGLFRIKQAEDPDAPAIAKVLGKPRCGDNNGTKGVAASAAAGPVAKAAARRRGLWGRGRGSYGTRGQGGTGSVVGTTWFTKETCAGTFWKVIDGVGITVDPDGKKGDVFLGPGDDYFAED